ncbi:MAG: phosphatidylserine decarboxylase [bacterium]|nr:phosphatidylserine decarboxylase [bacterium]
MRLGTKKLLFKTANKLGINRYFHRIVPVAIRTDPKELISPVEGKLEAIALYTQDHTCRIKNKPINLSDHLGDYTTFFTDGTVLSFYLAPTNKHFRLLPNEGKALHLHAQSGAARYFQTILGAEKLLRYLP